MKTVSRRSVVGFGATALLAGIGARTEQATTLKDVTPPMFIDGISVYNSPTDYRAIHHLQLTRFDGTTLAPIGRPALLDDIAG
jgi:hypothetical protein